MLGFNYPPVPLIEVVGGKKSLEWKMSQPSIFAKSHISLEDISPQHLASRMGIKNVWAIMNKIPSEKIGAQVKTELQKRHIGALSHIYFDADIFSSSLEGRVPLSGVAVGKIKGVLDAILIRTFASIGKWVWRN